MNQKEKIEEASAQPNGRTSFDEYPEEWHLRTRTTTPGSDQINPLVSGAVLAVLFRNPSDNCSALLGASTPEIGEFVDLSTDLVAHALSMTAS